MRKLLFIVLVMSLAVFVTACGDELASSGKDKVTLKIVSQYGGTDPATEAFENLLKEFEAEHTNVTIENDSGTAGDEFNTKVQTRWNAKDYPDLTFFFADEKGEFIINSGNVVSMDELFKEEPELEAVYNPAVLDQIRDTQNGELYSLPVNGYYEGLIVNKSLFEAEGLELPETWEKLETAIKAFSQTDIIPISASLVSNQYLIDNYVLAAGGVAGHNDPYSDAYVKGLELVKQTFEMGAYPADALTIDHGASQDYFKTGQAAMLIDGSWAVGGLPEEIADVSTVLPIPVAPGGALDYGDIISGFSSGWYLTKSAYEDKDKKELVVKLLKHLTSKEAIKAISESQGSVPAADVVIEGLNPAQEAGMQMVNNAGALELAADGFISNAAFMYIRDHMPEMITGKISIEKVLEESKKLEAQSK